MHAYIRDASTVLVWFGFLGRERRSLRSSLLHTEMSVKCPSQLESMPKTVCQDHGKKTHNIFSGLAPGVYFRAQSLSGDRSTV